MPHETILTSWKRGEDVTVATLTCLDQDENPVDLSSGAYSLLWQLRPTEPSSKEVEVDIDLNAPGSEDGVVTGIISREVTETMSVGYWVSDIRVIDTATNKALISKTFKVYVHPQVTREEV